MQLNDVAKATEGYSGADLQAVLYNAHLEVVHASIAAIPTTEPRSPEDKEMPIVYTTLGDPAGKTVTSKAEQMALQQRVIHLNASR